MNTHQAFSKKSFALLFKRSAFDLIIIIITTITHRVISLFLIKIVVPHSSSHKHQSLEHQINLQSGLRQWVDDDHVVDDLHDVIT